MTNALKDKMLGYGNVQSTCLALPKNLGRLLGGGVLILPDIEIHDYVCILTVAGCVLMSLACVVIECWVYIPGLCCDWKLC